MSTHSPAYAKGFGVLIGIILLWAVWLLPFLLFPGFFFGVEG